MIDSSPEMHLELTKVMFSVFFPLLNVVYVGCLARSDINKQEAASEMKQPAQRRPAKKENFTFPHQAKPLVKAFRCHISTKCPKILFLLPASELKALFYSTHLTDMKVQGAEISVNVPSVTVLVHQQILCPIDGCFYGSPLTCFSPGNMFLQLPWCGAHHLSQIKVKKMFSHVPLTISPSLFLVALHQPLEKQLPVTTIHLGAPACDCGSDSGQAEGFHLNVFPSWLQEPRCSFSFLSFF